MLSSLLTSIVAMQLYSKLHRAIRRARVVSKENSPSRGTSNAVDDLLSWSRCDDEYFSDEKSVPLLSCLALSAFCAGHGTFGGEGGERGLPARPFF